MKRRRHTPEQIIRKLAHADTLLGEGKSVAEVARELEVTEATFHRWRNQYGGMKGEDAKRLKELERENARLKKLVAEQALDIDMRERGRPGKLRTPNCRRKMVIHLCEQFAGLRTTGLPGDGSTPVDLSAGRSPSRATRSWHCGPGS